MIWSMNSQDITPNQLRHKLLANVQLESITDTEEIEKLMHGPSLKAIQNYKYDGLSKVQCKIGKGWPI